MQLHPVFTDRRGSVLPIFALSIIPIFGVIGASVDYTRASAARASIQAALDSAALMLSKDAASVQDGSLGDKAHDYFFTLFHHPEAQNVTVNTPVYTAASGVSQLTITASADIKTNFMKVVGYSQLHVGSSATVKWGNNKLRVALALDNTGSMASSGKMTALKTATKNLLDSLKNAATKDGDVYVSIIPFSKDVNVKLDANTYTKDWLDWSSWNAANGSCSKTQYTTKNSCTNHSGTWTAANHSTWNGCVTDRDQVNDAKNTTPVVGSTSTLFPAEQFSGCAVSVQPLTYNWTDLKTKVDAMTPTGNTNITVGLAWAWQSLTENAPLNAPAIDPADTIPTQKIIILLTDGDNTENRWTTSQSSIDARTKATCQNIKDAGITLYTVLVMQGNASLLQDCASNPKYFFNLTSADQIITTFNQIGTQLSKLRIAQ